MRKVKLYIATSLDGFIARKDGSLDWLTDLPGGEGTDHGYHDFYATIDTVVMGRKTYDEVLGFDVEWPYADCETFVVSRTGQHKIKTDNTRLVSGEFVETLRSMKKIEGKDIWLVGGGELISMCMAHALVDEIILSIAPVILGDGIPLFPEIKSEVKLDLEEVKRYPTGIVMLAYHIKQ